MKEHRSILALLRPLDFAVIGAVLFLALSMLLLPFFSSTQGALAEVHYPDGHTEAYSLDTEQTVFLSGNGYVLCLSIADGAARVTEANCEEEVCRLRGAIFREGESILCSRAEILICIRGGEVGYDGIAG